MTATGQALFNQAESEWERGQFAAAFKLYRNYLDGWIKKGDLADAFSSRLTDREMRVLERLADLAALFGWWDPATHLLNLSMEFFKEAGNPWAADVISLKMVSLEINRGHIRHALERLRQLSAVTVDPCEIEFTDSGFAQWEAQPQWAKISAAGRTVFLSRLYLEIGRLEAALGEYTRALATFKRGLFHCRAGVPELAQELVVPLLLALASAELERGDLPSAEAALQGLPLYSTYSPQAGSAVQRLEILGKVALLGGDLGKANDRYGRALRICESLQFEQAAALAKLNRAQVLIYLNQTREARALLLSARATALHYRDEALKARADILLRHATARAQSLAERVSIAVPVVSMWGASDQSESAEPDAASQEQSDVIIEGNYLARFEERALQFYWHLGHFDWEAASQHLKDIVEVYRTTDSVLIRTRLLVMESLLDYYAGDYADAVDGFQRARHLLQKMRLLPELWQVQRFIRWCLVRLGRSREAEVAGRDAESTLAVLSESLPDVDKAIFRLNKWVAEEEYITGEIDRLARLKLALSTGNWLLRGWLQWQLRTRLGALLDYVDRYKGLLARRVVKGEKASLTAATGRRLWRRLFSYPRRQATMSFVVLPDQVLVAQTSWMSLEFRVSPMTRIQLRDAVSDWHELVLAGDDSSLRKAQQVMAQLAEKLKIGELLERLPARIHRLVFVPDDSLHGLPFAALRYQDKYLIERWALSVAFEWAGRREVATKRKGMLAVSITKEAGEYQPLHEARKEMEQVREQFTAQGFPVTCLTDEQADKQTLLRLLPDASLFHIACHGTFRPNHPEKSGLVLLSRGKPDILSLRELANLNLTKLEQAVLSACWSADSFVLPGRWVITLPETLWRAGGRSILGTLWEVDDRFVGSFISRFYYNLRTLSRSESLRRIQLDCINGRLNEHASVHTADPIYWAGFTLYGDSGRLILNP